MEFYIQSRVYKILLNKDGTASPWLQQDNNALKVTEFNITLKNNTTIKEILEATGEVDRVFLGRNHAEDKVLKYEGPIPTDFMVMTGTFLNTVKADLNKPVVIDEGQDDAEALSKAAEDKEVANTFVYIMPIFSDSAWDFTITSAPEGAVEKSNMIDGVDTTTMTDVEMEKFMRELMSISDVEPREETK